MNQLLKTMSGALAMSLCVGLGCAHSAPPGELVEARAAYSRASAGPAREQASARLQLAWEALDRAEADYRNNVDEDRVRGEAYVALRRTEAAEAEAAAALATARRRAALRELATLQGLHADRARAQLEKERQRATAEGARADVASQQAAEEAGRAQAAQQQAAEEAARAQAAQQQADRERQARMEAQARAQQAMNELSRVAKVRQEPRGLVVTLSGQVLFASGEATLLPASASSLDTVAAALRTLPPNSGKVVIEGHTDSTGPRELNLELSDHRARAVRDYLVSKGVSGDAFTIEGLGPDRPVASNRTSEGRANNRRVEIVIPPATPVTSPPASPGTTPEPRPSDTTPPPITPPAQNPPPAAPGPTPTPESPRP